MSHDAEGVATVTGLNNRKSATREAATNSIFVGGGEMGELMRSLAWSQTSLGDVATWSQGLRSAISILLPSKAQICLFWGPEYITLYNDAYRPVFAAKHPWVLGRPVRETWSETWDILQPLLEGVVTTGEAFWAKDYLFFINRSGYIEETYFDVSYDPVRDESGNVGGVFCIVSETTGRVLGDRRLQTLSLLARETAPAHTVAAACQAAMPALATNLHDIPFALLYEIQPDGRQATLVESAGIAADTAAAPTIVDLAQEQDGWGFRQIYQRGQATIVEDLQTRFGSLLRGAWDRSPTIGDRDSGSAASRLLLTNLEILVVDDEADTRELTAFTLKQAGAIVTAVSSASRALTVFAQAEFDILVSDIGMPEMDGYAFMRQIRQLRQGNQIPAIALTAYAGESNQQQAIAAGFQAHLSKPVEPDALIAKIAQCLKRQGEA